MSQLQDSDGTPDLKLTFDAIDYLSEARRWAFILSILGFVFIGLIVLMAFSLGSMMSSIYGQSGQSVPSTMFTVVYLGMAVVYFFPVLYLFNFARSTKNAIDLNDSESLARAFKNLKSLYKFIGILTILVLGFYALFLMFFVVGGALPSMMS